MLPITTEAYECGEFASGSKSDEAPPSCELGNNWRYELKGGRLCRMMVLGIILYTRLCIASCLPSLLYIRVRRRLGMRLPKIRLAGGKAGGGSDPASRRAAAGILGASLGRGEQPAAVAHSSAAAWSAVMYQMTTW